MRRGGDARFDDDFDDTTPEDDEHPRVNDSRAYRLLRYGPVVAAVTLVSCAFLAYRLAAQVAVEGTIRIWGPDAWSVPLIAVALVSVGVAADHFVGWAVHPWRLQVRTRGVIAALLLASLFFAAIAAPWFQPEEPLFDRAVVVLCVAGLLCIPPAVTDIACRAISFLSRKRWR